MQLAPAELKLSCWFCSSPVLPVCAQTPSGAPYQEEEASGGGAPGGAGSQTPAEWSCASGSFPDNVAEGEMR